MEELTIQQIMEKYPYLKKDSERILFVTMSEYEKLRKSETIELPSKSKKVIVEILKRILNDDFYFEYASRYFSNQIDKFAVWGVKDGDTALAPISYDKSTIIEGFQQLISSGKIILGSDERRRYQFLKDSISFDKFLEKNKGNNYNLSIDEKKYSIPNEQLISVMKLPDEQFDMLLSNDKIKNIYNVPKNHFIYAAFKFFEESKVIGNFLVPDNICKHYRELKSLQKVDFEALNKILFTADTKYKEINLNNELRRAIVEGMPEDATDLEKAIYIYIRMCKLFTYDDEYFAVNQRGEAAKKHKSADYISSITLENNKIVCFEFNLIYAKFLNELGIHFLSDYKGMTGESFYGEGHANLEFRTGKFLVNADSVTSILIGDITRAKLNEPLVGIKCNNINMQTQNEFKSSVTKMYQLIALQDKDTKQKQQIEHIPTLDELLSEYSSIVSSTYNIDLNERLSILMDKINSTEMVGIDLFSYILQLRKILFTEEQRKNNIDVTIIRNNNPFEEGRIAMSSAIFTLNDYSFEESPEQNIYYSFDSNYGLNTITKEELQSKFDDGIFEYINQDTPKVPGIVENGGKIK